MRGGGSRTDTAVDECRNENDKSGGKVSVRLALEFYFFFACFWLFNGGGGAAAAVLTLDTAIDERGTETAEGVAKSRNRFCDRGGSPCYYNSYIPGCLVKVVHESIKINLVGSSLTECTLVGTFSCIKND